DTYLHAFQHDYYSADKRHAVYPFIVHNGDQVIAQPDHCTLDVLSQPALVADLKHASEGSGDYLANGQWVWVTFTRFQGWDWTVGYAIPHDIKYADLYLFRKILLAVMAAFTTVALVVLAVIVKRNTEPLIRLTGAASSIAAGNLNDPIDINGTGEVRMLASSFALMREAIRRDMHTLKDAKDALAQSEETLRSILNCSPDAITMLDTHGHILENNPAAARLHQWDPQALMGRSELDLVSPEDRNKAAIGLQQALQHGEVRDLELTFLRQDGSTFTGEITLNAIPDSQGQAQALVAITRDVTNNVHYEELWDAVDTQLQPGVQLSAALFDSPLIPDSVSRMIH
ncbi:MAG: PAS domain S-box protein, partial [Chlorobiales bacterium]|nr:PAS domain S-box protein [Chlorobiales bacterium]